MEYLYALILARNQNYQSAVDHVSTYLKLAPQAADAQNAQKLLEQLQQHSQTSAAK
jgi:regulator of sirC expression with transglutaminase-like and TPR domain